jgi:hypothetical protein
MKLEKYSVKKSVMHLKNKPNYYIEGHTDLLLFHTSKKIQAEFILEAFQERVGLFQFFLKQAKEYYNIPSLRHNQSSL